MHRPFEGACPWIDWRTAICPVEADRLPVLAERARARAQPDGYDLAVNCDGFNPFTTEFTSRLRPRYAAGSALDADLSGPLPLGDHPHNRILAEPDWTSPDFLRRYADHLTSNYIGELFARMAFVETDFFAISLETAPPPFRVPEVLVHANANRTAKLWPASRWHEVLDWCRSRELSVGLVGVVPKAGQERTIGYPIEAELVEHDAVVDLRGRTTPIQLAGALGAARACVTVDSGPLHVAAAVGCPTVAIFGNDAEGVGASPLDLWLPRVGSVRRTVSKRSCGDCAANRFLNGPCLRDRHVCMEGVGSDQVIELLREALGREAV